MAVFPPAGPIFVPAPIFVVRAGFNFAVRTGNGTTNPDFDSFIEDSALFMATDFLELHTKLGAEYAGRDENTGNDNVARYAVIAGDGTELRDNEGNIGKPTIWTSKGYIGNTKRCRVVNPADSVNVEDDIFNGTEAIPGPTEYGWEPGQRLAVLADALPVLPPVIIFSPI